MNVIDNSYKWKSNRFEVDSVEFVVIQSKIADEQSLNNFWRIKVSDTIDTVRDASTGKDYTRKRLDWKRVLDKKNVKIL